MNDDNRKKTEIQSDIRELSELIGMLSTKYKEEPLVEDVQAAFMNLSAHVGRALKIQLQ